MTIKQEVQALESNMQDLQGCVYELRRDYKRINQHRRQHKKGIKDKHTNYKTMTEHIEALNLILKNKLKDIRYYTEAIDKKYDRLHTLYMYMDASEDLIVDAELSHRETIKELQG